MQGNEDRVTGLRFSARVFYPEEQNNQRDLLSFLTDLLILGLLFFGAFLLVITGLSVSVSPWFYGFLLLLVSISAGYFRREGEKRGGLLRFLLFLILYAVLLYFLQDRFLSGAKTMLFALRTTMRSVYQGEKTNLFITGAEQETACFLAFTAVPLVMGAADLILHRENFLLFTFFGLPFLAFLFLLGMGSSIPALFMLLFGILGAFASTRVIRHKRLWKKEDPKVYENNRRRYVRVRRRYILSVLLLSVILSVPGYYLIVPFLRMQLTPAEHAANELQGEFLGKLLSILPEISAEQWNLEVETIGGGVSEGALSEEDGYRISEVEDLRVTVTRKPEETIYLKGFVGTDYLGDRWRSRRGADFDYISVGQDSTFAVNASFLRTANVFEEKEALGDALAGLLSDVDPEPVRIFVKRLGANQDYTYVPYGAFLNQEYEVTGGDGGILGRENNEDRLYFYYREDYEKALEVWQERQGQTGALDQAEASYRAYCREHYLLVSSGLETLQEKVEEQKEKNHLDPAFDREEIVSWVIAFLSENYAFAKDTGGNAEGEDFLRTFLFDTKEGSSVHFASAGVVLFRMFGIPARYVIGYEAPAGLFSVQSDGTYAATLKDSHAQAWVEIYGDGIGWLPVDVTPGLIGTREEVGAGGEKLQVFEHEKEDVLLEEAEEEPEDVPKVTFSERMTEAVNTLLHTEMTLAQMIHLFLLLLLLVSGGIIFVRTLSWICDRNGFDLLRRRTETEKILRMFALFCAELRRKGMPAEVDSASEEFLTFAEKHRKKNKAPDPGYREELRSIRDHIYGAFFGNEEISREDIRTFRSFLGK